MVDTDVSTQPMRASSPIGKSIIDGSARQAEDLSSQPPVHHHDNGRRTSSGEWTQRSEVGDESRGAPALQDVAVSDDGDAGDVDAAGRNAAGRGHRSYSEENVPVCLIRTRDAAEACSLRAQAWADKQDLKAKQRIQRRTQITDGGVQIDQATGKVIEAKGDPFLQQKGMSAVVVVILAWVYIVFTWRICVRAIQKKSDATATRTEGIGLLVGFHILWLLAIWSYLKVFLTGPGLARDYSAITSPPMSPVQMQTHQFSNATESDGDQVSPPSENRYEARVEDSQNEHSIDNHDNEQSLIQALRTTSADEALEDGADEDLDTTTAAFVGPIGASVAAQRDEAERLRHTAEASTEKREGTEGVNVSPASPILREPMRQPQDAMPLHPANRYCYRCRRVKPPRAHHCRHCGTCVLKMDHHCPWVGGCVGAGNHKYFFNFLEWVTLLEIFVLVVNAVLFARGINRRANGRGAAGWTIDGYMISLFPITATFTLFTGLLVGMHAYLFIFNLTTIEHLMFERIKTRERIDIDHYLTDRSRKSGAPEPNMHQRMSQARAIKKRYADHWGSLKTETNMWWLDGRRRGPTFGLDGVEREAVPARIDAPETGIKESIAWWQAAGANWRENMGNNVLGWLLPIGKARNFKGTAYEANWRFGPFGEWTPREQWPQRWQNLQQALEKDEPDRP